MLVAHKYIKLSFSLYPKGQKKNSVSKFLLLLIKSIVQTRLFIHFVYMGKIAVL